MKQHYGFRTLREKAGISGFDAAYAAGISFPTYYSLETKPSDPNADTLLAVLKMLASVGNQSPSAIFDKVVTLPEDGPGVEETVLDRAALKAYRERANLTTRELHQEAELSSSTVNTLELLPVNAQADTLLTVIKVFAEKLNLPPQRILDDLL